MYDRESVATHKWMRWKLVIMTKPVFTYLYNISVSILWKLPIISSLELFSVLLHSVSWVTELAFLNRFSLMKIISRHLTVSQVHHRCLIPTVSKNKIRQRRSSTTRSSWLNQGSLLTVILGNYKTCWCEDLQCSAVSGNLPCALLEPTFRQFYFRCRLDTIMFKKPKTKSIPFCFVSWHFCSLN